MTRAATKVAGLLILLALVGCCRVVVKQFDSRIHGASSYQQNAVLYVCSGEQIDFRWHVKCVDHVAFYTNTGRRLHTGGARGEFTTEPAAADWSYIEVKGCKDGRCERVYVPVEVIDQGNMTRAFFVGDEPGLEIVGGPLEVDTAPDPAHRSQGLYKVYRSVQGFNYTVAAEQFSSRARATEVWVQNMEMPADGIDPAGMNLTWGAGNAAPTWVPKDNFVVTLSTPIHPAQTQWRLRYATPQRIFVGHSYHAGDSDVPKPQVAIPRDISDFPQLTFHLICAAAPPSP